MAKSGGYENIPKSNSFLAKSGCVFSLTPAVRYGRTINFLLSFVLLNSWRGYLESQKFVVTAFPGGLKVFTVS